MPRLFGTDGIRGVANVDLKPTVAYALGRAVAKRLVGPGGEIVVGQDTRRSGDMFVSAIAAGATSLGADVHVVGVVPTPALAYITGSGPFAAGIMVSASHNPAADNGLKVLDADGLKLDDAIEDELERSSGGRRSSAASATTSSAGRSTREPARGVRGPPARLADASTRRRSGSCSTPRTARGRRSGRGSSPPPAHVEVIHAEPDGININVASGATAPAPRRRGRGAAAPTSGSRSTATRTG
jgi:phosphoglucosamine mutase